MANEIPTNFRDLFNKRAFAHLATVMKDGTPQVTPVWCDFDGTHVILNSAKGRIKEAAGNGAYAKAWKDTAGKVASDVPSLPAADPCS